MNNHQLQSANGRILWIDVCRVLMMAYVIYEHFSYEFPFESHNLKTTLAFPFYILTGPCGVVLMFFFFSGLLNKTKARYLDWRKFCLFMIPTVIWNIICMLIMHKFPSTFMGWLGATGILPPYLGNIPGMEGLCNYPLWFMSFLAYFSLLFPLLSRIGGTVQACLALGIFLYTGIYAWMDLGSAAHARAPLLFPCHSLGVYIVGIYLSRFGIARVSEFLGKNAWWLTVLLLALSLSPLLSSDAWRIFDGFGPLLAVLALCSYGMLFTQCFPKVAAWVAQWAGAMFFVYAFHVPFAVSLNKCISLPTLSVFSLGAFVILCYVVGILAFTYMKTNVKWFDRFVFMRK